MTLFSVEFAIRTWVLMLGFLGIVHRGAYTPYRTVQTSGGMQRASRSRIAGTLQNSGSSFKPGY